VTEPQRTARLPRHVASCLLCLVAKQRAADAAIDLSDGAANNDHDDDSVLPLSILFIDTA